MTDYSKLLEKSKEIMIWSTIFELVSWDFETKMPPGATGQRSEQMALIEKLYHDKAVDPEIGSLLASIKENEALDEEAARNVYLIQRSYDQETKIPSELVVEMAKHHAISVDTWKKAKAAKDFEMFRPALDKMIDLNRQKAHYLNPDKDPYDVMVDLYEPGITVDAIAGVFGPLKQGLVPLVKKCVESDYKPGMSFMNQPVAQDIQQKISSALMTFVKYDLTRGRLDETEHPFTTGIYDDVRICTHYYETNFVSSLFAVLHEAGHAIYEQAIPKTWQYQPIGASCSMGIHESQSRFIENIVGRSEAFWTYFLPELKQLVGGTLDGVDLPLMVRAANDVRPTKIRIEADEVTYSLHVILRFELEQQIMRGEMETTDLPQAWNDKMAQLLGIEIENDSEGVMQDTHWASGMFGYFPDYAMGNVYDGMFLECLEREVPSWRDSVATGDVSPVLDWMHQNVHAKGNTMDAIDLVQAVAGKSLDAQPFLDYLNAKMSSIYGF
jgi:carboxypeptidase Taq